MCAHVKLLHITSVQTLTPYRRLQLIIRALYTPQYSTCIQLLYIHTLHLSHMHVLYCMCAH